jgi:hypothetical protein
VPALLFEWATLMTPGTQRLLVEGAWFSIWAVIVGAMAWLFGEPSTRVPLEALLGGLGALGAFRLLA